MLSTALAGTSCADLLKTGLTNALAILMQALMREHMRNTDRAVSNIESHPEGFNALRRMYENVQVQMSYLQQFQFHKHKDKV